MMNDVRSWLTHLGLGQYAELFDQHAIGLDILRELTEPDLAGLGIPLGDRKRILKAMAHLPPESGEDDPGRNGAPNTRDPTPEPERRCLTVMFCDLVGSTALARRLDPEDLRSVIQAYQDCCAGVVARYDGFISRHIGDGILIYFGYPKAHEDDAERALNAALDLVQAIGHLTTRTGGTLEARIGVTTGLVIVGDMTGAGPMRELLAHGNPLNVASRLQNIALPNTIVVDQATHDMTAGLFTFEALGEHNLKGIVEPVQAWSVCGKTQLPSRFTRARGTRIVPFVNRSHELEALSVAWAAARSGKGQLVLLTGEPGIGKSRLVQVFEGRLTSQPHTYRFVQSSPYHQSTALYPFVEQVRNAAALNPDDPPEQKLSKLAAHFANLPDGLEAASLFATLLSIPEEGASSPVLNAVETRETTFRIILEQLTRLSAEQPLLLVIEDAQWLDPTSLELLDVMAHHIRDRPVLMLVTYRADFSLSLMRNHPFTLLQLDRLQRADCRVMVEHVADQRALPSALVNRILDRADGIALFVEELTKAVLESHAAADHGNRHEPGSTASALVLPATLNGLLMARLDRYPQAREIAQIGAVIGREFPLYLVAEVAGQTEAQVRTALARLVEAELLLQAGSANQETYRFKHALVQDAASGSLLISKRRMLHARVAEIIEACDPARASAEPALLAYHFDQAGRSDAAVPYYLKAGQQSLERSAMAEAIAALRAGLDLIPNLPPAEARQWELELQVLLGHALRATRAPSASETGQAWDRARQLCQTKQDNVYLQQAIYGQFLFHQGNANLRQARQLGEDLLTLAGQEGDCGAFIRGHSAVGRTAFGQGDFTAAQYHLEQALHAPDISSQISSVVRGPESRVLNLCYLAWTLFLQGRCAEGTACCAASIETALQSAQPYDVVVAHGNACYLHQFRRDPDAAAACAERVIHLAADQGFTAWLSLGQIFHGWVLAQTGRVETGLPIIEAALAEHRATGEKLEVPYFLGMLAECYLEVGRYQDGIAAVEEAAAMTHDTGEAWFNAELYRIRGEMHRAVSVGSDRQAIRCFRQALGLARAQGARLWELRAGLSLAASWGSSRCRRAGRLLEPIVAAFPDETDLTELEQARRIGGALHA
jgi:class 3 adenylate cyclase/predicted ATPase/energy-coupling factor transporter ATP-binding protein EcfA2